ncbi:ATP-dependent DNA ligase [Microlunatus elymi]|uniref:DNA ligase n=1 Tax=Microlunatus elymi TaxID=2596828 RepID=A0A516PWL1_9ACTN|nr:ATP-dependent DNA ligase [Microlunatus elymi]QDP95568.1 ATP-dependent DNA ligase [Microlunatus elymi]
MTDDHGILLDRLVAAWRGLAATRSRNAKRDLIAAVLREATAADVEIVVSYLSGSLRQRRTGIGWHSLQDLPAPAAEASLRVVEVDAAFEQISGLAGPGSAALRQAAVAELFGRATAGEQELLRGLIFGELRQGALESAVQDGLAAAYDVDRATVRRAAMLLGSTTAAAHLLLTEGEQALAEVSLQVGIAVQPMLAASAPDVEAALAKSGLPAVIDAKLDGIRVQVHKHGSKINIFTRSLDEITERLPQVVATVAALPQDQLVLDGEALALRPDGRPEVFQQIASSAATRSESAGAERLPLQAYFFDLLRIDELELLDQPLAERSVIMTDTLPPALLVPRLITDDGGRAADFYADVVAQGFEGVVIKDPTASYAAGRRDAGWVKVKPRHTFDLVIIAAEWGHGRRQGWLSNLHLAARSDDGEELIMLGKTFKGLTDEMLAWQTERFLQLEERRVPGIVFVRPELVAEIAVDGLQTSPRYPGGVALRFARVLRYREDKPAAEADTISTVKRLLPAID